MRERAALTARQRELLEFVRRGHSNREIAAALKLSEDTVKAHLSRLYLRFDVPNRAALVAATGGLLPAAVQTSTSTSLASLRAMAGHARTQSRSLDGSGESSDARVMAVRDALAAVDVALGLVTELPAETSGVLVAAVRKRIDEAFAALAQLEAPQPTR